MKFTIFAVVAAVATAQIVDLDDGSAPVRARFEAYNKQYIKAYGSDTEHASAFMAFAANDAIIAEHNSQDLTTRTPKPTKLRGKEITPCAGLNA